MLLWLRHLPDRFSRSGKLTESPNKEDEIDGYRKSHSSVGLYGPRRVADVGLVFLVVKPGEL